MRDRQLGYSSVELLRHLQGAHAIGVGHDSSKLLTAITYKDITRANNAIVDGPGNAGQAFVTGMVTM